MKHDAALPTEEQIDSLINRLLPANKHMDAKSASIIPERQGYDRPRLAAAGKKQVERRIAGMRERGKDVPPQLL